MENPKPKSTISLKTRIFLFFIFTTLIFCCLSIILFIIARDTIKNSVCNNFSQSSIVWQKLGCSPADAVESEENTIYPLEQNRADRVYSESDITEMVENAVPSVVGIGIGDTGYEKNVIIGTGFLISKGGLIATNRHVVEDESFDYYMTFAGSDNVAFIKSDDIFRDPVNDIALIKIDPKYIPPNIRPIPVGDSDKIKLGETVIAIGNPLGTYTSTVTKGIVSGLGREVTITKGFFSSEQEVYEDVIQTDAAINPGNSGGPLVNSKGEVIGINFATIQGASNLSFAMPINRIKVRIRELEKFGKFVIPFLGVEYRTKSVLFSGKSMIGAEVTKVIAGSPASDIGLKKSDIIIEFGGNDLQSKSLFALIQEHKVGDKVKIVLIRNNAKMELSVTIGQR